MVEYDQYLYWYRARLVRIIDADTLVLDISMGIEQWTRNQHCRLLGIDAPEVRGPEKQRGKKSRDYLESLLPPIGEDLVIHTEMDRRGSFYRLLIDVYYNGKNINQLMVESGHAIEWRP